MQKQLIGQRYRIKGLIGEGGMASVYAALDEKLDRRVAIKVLHPHLARNNDIRDRFLLEAKTVSTLDHPNIIKVYDFSGLDSEQLWMVTEILYGVDLAEYVKRFAKNRLHPIVAALIVREICRALSEVHKLQIVHRDIKPENIMMLDSGHVKLMDFGIAKVHRANATQTGTFMGSPSYMSPEQIRGSDVDVRADIYSLSVLFYEIITGALPYLGQTTAEVINKIMVGRYTPPNLLTTDLPYTLNEIIIRGMQSQKEQRYQDIRQLVQALDQFLQSCGFGESRIELEKFTLQRQAFEERLAKLRLPKTSQHRLDTHTNILDPVGDRNVQTRFLPSQTGKQSASVHKSVPPRSIAPHDGHHDPHLPRSHAPSKREHRASQVKTPGPTEILHNRAADAMRVPDTQPPPQAPSSRVTHAPQSGHAPRSTVPPHSAVTGAPVAHRRQPVRRIFIREHVVTDGRSRRSSSSTFLLFGLIAAIALVFVLGGDKLTNRFKRDTAKVSQQIETIGKKGTKKPRTEREENPSVATTTPPPDESSPSAPVDDPPTVVESQTVVIDSSSKAPPKVSEREVTTPRVNRSIPSTTRTLPSPSQPRPARDREVAVITRPNNPVNDRQERPTPTPDIQPVAQEPTERAVTTDRLPVEPPPRETGPGVLKIAALPAAEIMLDGKLFGTTNDKAIASDGIPLDPGTYVLKLRRKGYRAEETTVQIRAGEVRQLNVALTKAVDLVEFTIRTNRVPASAIIEDLRGGGRRREVTLSRQSLVLNLKPGTYRVTVSHSGGNINRVIELAEGDKSITFNAEFK